MGKKERERKRKRIMRIKLTAVIYKVWAHCCDFPRTLPAPSSQMGDKHTHTTAGGFVGNVLLWLMCPQWGLCKQCSAQLFQKLIFMSDSVSYSKPSLTLVMISPMGPIANTHAHKHHYQIHKHNSTQTLPRCNNSTWALILCHIKENVHFNLCVQDTGVTKGCSIFFSVRIRPQTSKKYNWSIQSYSL